MLGVVVRDAVLHAAAGIGGGGRQVPREVQRDAAQTRRIDLVVREPAGQRDLAAGVACRRRERREVAVQHRRRRHVADVRRRVAALDAPLIAAEEEHLVLQDRPAEHAAELIALEAVALGREGVARVEAVVADEVEGAAAEVVGAGLGDEIHRRRRVVAVAGRQRAGLDLELLQRVGKRRRQVQVVERDRCACRRP